MENPVKHERTKYISIDCDFIRSHRINGFVKPCYISSNKQVANIFTKALGATTFHSLLFKLNMELPHVQLEGSVLEYGI